MTAIEPFKVNASGPADVAKALGGVGEAIGSVVGSLGGGSRTRAAVKMHREQMLHEANQSQLGHERNLELMDKSAELSKGLDLSAQELRERDREHAMSSAANYISDAQSRVMGGRNFTMQETAEGGRTISHSVAAMPRAKAKPKSEAKPKAAVPAVTTPIETVPAAKKPRAKKTGTGTEIINTLAPGEQYND